VGLFLGEKVQLDPWEREAHKRPTSFPTSTSKKSLQAAGRKKKRRKTTREKKIALWVAARGLHLWRERKGWKKRIKKNRTGEKVFKSKRGGGEGGGAIQSEKPAPSKGQRHQKNPHKGAGKLRLTNNNLLEGRSFPSGGRGGGGGINGRGETVTSKKTKKSARIRSKN